MHLAASLSYIASQGNITITIVCTAISIGPTLGISYYKDKLVRARTFNLTFCPSVGSEFESNSYKRLTTYTLWRACLLPAEPCGVIVKYNPCTPYARGSPCPHFSKSRKCGELPLLCKMPRYDKWYKDVLKGKRKSFYPNRIKLLEKPGVPMFLYHVHYNAIVGEATITQSTAEGEKHFYWFDEFLSYPYPVEPELLKTDSRLPKARRGRWKTMYISSEVIEEIRFLSTLSNETRKEMGIDIDQLRKKPRRKPSWEYYMVNECNKLREKYAFSETVLNETQNYFSECMQKKLIAGGSARAQDVIFYAALYLAFRMLEIPKLFCDITNICGIGSRNLRKSYLLLAKRLNLTIPVQNPEDLVESHCVKLGVTRQTIDTAVTLARIARKNVMTMGKAPSAIAAAAVVVACEKENEKIRRRTVAELFDVSTVTIRNHYEELEAIFARDS